MIHQDVGVDGNKKVKGRKRHILVDSLGILMAVVVTAANISEGQGLRLLLEQVQSMGLNLERFYLLYVDGGYHGENLVHWVMDKFGWILEKVLRPEERKGFTPLPRRWELFSSQPVSTIDGKMTTPTLLDLSAHSNIVAISRMESDQ